MYTEIRFNSKYRNDYIVSAIFKRDIPARDFLYLAN